MQKANLFKKLLQIVLVILAVLSLFCLMSFAAESAIISTDKDTYSYGETIKVNFSGSPGNDGDWICIVPAGSLDTEGGDYKYLPKGVAQGFLTFDPPAPGKYEARVYYDYNRKGYEVSGRFAFSVVGGPDYARESALKMERMSRKVNPDNALEAGLTADNGMVYIFREPWALSSAVEVEIKANGKVIALVKNSDYLLFKTPSGSAQFTTGSFFERRMGSDKSVEAWSVKAGEATIDVKAGYVYYLRLKVVPMGGWAASLDLMPHQDAASFINTYQLTRIEKIP